jgi:hypothetical protein
MDNIVWMIAEKNSRRLFNAQLARFDEKITFGTFYPAKLDCEQALNSIVPRSSRNRYAIIEAEVASFDGREIVVAYDDSFRDISLTNFSLY